MTALNMGEGPHRVVRLFEAIILRPLSIAFLIAATISFLHSMWVVSFTMASCWFFVGAIGQALPHRKRQNLSELTYGPTPLPKDGDLSRDDAFALGKAVQRIGAVAGFCAFALAWKSGLRWYWILPWAVGSYWFVAVAGALLPALLARRARSAKENRPDAV